MSAFLAAEEASKRLGVSTVGLHILANHKRLAEWGAHPQERRYRKDQIDQLRRTPALWRDLIPATQFNPEGPSSEPVKEIELENEAPAKRSARPSSNGVRTADAIVEAYLKNLTPQQLRADLFKYAPQLVTRRALHVGSFDPPTNGHLWVIEQGAGIFDELIVGVGINPAKAYTFSTEERVAMLEELVKPFGNVTVKPLGLKLSAKFAKANGCKYILQGIRNSADYEYQKAQRYANSDIADGVEPYFLFPPRNLVETSSSFVKSLVGFEDWEEVAQKLVSPLVFEKLKQKYKKD